MWIAVVLGLICFLLINHPIAFWCLFVPLIVLFLVFIINWIITRGFGVMNFVSACIVFVMIVILIPLVVSTDQCKHEESRTRYVFTSYRNMEYEYSSTARYCKECDERLTRHSLFQGELVDKSYLRAIEEHSDGSAIIPGEYYTVSVTVPMGFYGFTSDTVWLTCEVENEDFKVRFDVEFRDEFKELVASIEEGEEITFRGRFYDKGCGFTDSELINDLDNIN